MLRYGNKEQLHKWLIRLLNGKIRSGFAMTEPQVASSDATKIECSIKREGDTYIINGTKWWTSGATDPRCKVLIVMARLGPGRLHHCMRLIGAAERGMQMMAQRALSRRVFGKLIAEQELEKARLLVLEAADQLDKRGNKKARGIIAMAKVAAPNMALKVLDMVMQVHGGAGLSSNTVLAHLWATARTLRTADGPDEVHLGTIGKLELQRTRL
ncbi:hypothetical protein CMV_013629 [Castanea mollissima]|uniref:Acyl-CoA dehydrogenase/oxidase C-terminal domain-containing protein n=1 Tax=Castanea mollissima TaxID=60419 RepID=A0A8J4R188_9ROSI|nr:hypothetical protein CMV_013629 [Castanea mollissima]